MIEIYTEFTMSEKADLEVAGVAASAQGNFVPGGTKRAAKMVGLDNQEQELNTEAHRLTMYPELSCCLEELIWLVIRQNLNRNCAFLYL